MKKPIPRRRRRQAPTPPPSQDDIRAYLATVAKEGLAIGNVALVTAQCPFIEELPAPSFALDGHVIRPGKSRHGPLPRPGKREYAQRAIGMLYPTRVPEKVSDLQLCRKVNKWLKTNPAYVATGLGEISRQTVARARRRNLAANP